MKNKKITLLLILLLVLLLSGAYVLYNALSKEHKSNQLTTNEQQNKTKADASNDSPSRTAAPDFTIYDYDGSAVTLSDFKGKPVILNFWASWCNPCKSEMPDFEKMYQTYGNDIHFLMVNMTDGFQETELAAKEFITEASFSFPVYFDKDTDAANTYRVYSIPTTYFIDADGYIAAQGNGALDASSLEQGISMIQE